MRVPRGRVVGEGRRKLSQLLPLILVLVAAAILSAASVPAFARFARARGIVAKPRGDRWSTRPTPLLGGAGICLGTLAVLAFALPPTAQTLVVISAGLGAFALGLLDDLRPLAPTTKLVGQVLVASVLILGGVQVEIVTFAPLAFVLTVFWVVGLMNAINLMDNMDGLAAGIAAIAALALGITALPEHPEVAIVALATAGAASGFLVHNFFPARVFMGDAGSLLLGLLLAAAALMHTATGAANVGLAVLAPLAVLALPLFDTALVTASRRLAGRPISQGGRDHTSHRLTALGLSDRGAVLFLYALAAVLATLALVAEAAGGLMLPLFALAVIGLILFGVFLSEVDVYGTRRRISSRGPVAGLMSVYGRFGAEVGLDVALLTTAYYSAYVLRFEGVPQSSWLPFFTESLPIVVGLQLAALVISHSYRTLWRYLSLSDAVLILRALAIGTAAAVLILLLAFRFDGYSRAVFVLDGVLAAALLVGIRFFLLWLRQWFSARPRPHDRRVLIIGASETGDLALRLLSRLGGGPYRAVAFLDDDPGKRYRRIGGVPIVGSTSEFETAVRRLEVDMVLLATPRSEFPEADDMHRRCGELGIDWQEFVVALPQSARSSSAS